MSRLSVRREDAAQIFGEESAARRAQGLLLALHLAGQRTSPSPDTTVHCTLYTVHCTQHHCPGPGTAELDLAKLTNPATRPLVSITENIKQIQGLFGLVDIHRGF